MTSISASIKDLSSLIPECGADWLDDMHRVFCLPYENGMYSAIEKLKGTESLGNTFIGTGSFFVLDLASVREQVENIVMIDRSNRSQAFWGKIEKIIRAADDQFDCLDKIEAHIDENYQEYFLKKGFPESAVTRLATFKERILEHLEWGMSWLSSETRFNKIKKIFSEDRFAYLRLDYSDSKAFEQLGQVIGKKDLKIDGIYFSNVIEYLAPEDQDNFAVSLGAIVEDSAWIIDTMPRSFFKDPLHQQVRKFENSQKHDEIRKFLVVEESRILLSSTNY